MPGQIVLNEELFKIFENKTILCVRDVVYDIDEKLNEKYLENCCDAEINNKSDNTISCKECWRKFLTNDLIKIKEYNPKKVKVILANKEIIGHTRSKEMSEYEKCQNAVDNNRNKITATVDGKRIIGPCEISIITKTKTGK